MENTRIQRLILSEYKELSGEMILVESPFAETTRDGRGLREVALALTKTKLIIARDMFKSKNQCYSCRSIDPCIETLELVSIYPLNFITLSVFCKRHRKTLKARLIDGRTKYYELGGMQRKAKFWTLWCDHVHKILAHKCLGSSLSETSAAASSTCPSTMYDLSSDFEYDSAVGRCRKTRRRSENSSLNSSTNTPIWNKKNLYLGSSFEELKYGNYTPVPVRFQNSSLTETKNKSKNYSLKTELSKDECKSYSRRKTEEPQEDNLCNVIFTRRNNKRCVDKELLYAELNNNIERERGGSNTHRFRDISPFVPKTLLDIIGPETNSLTLTSENNKKSKFCTRKSQVDKQNKKIGMHAAKIARMFTKFASRAEDKNTSSTHLESSKSNLCENSTHDLHEMIERAVSIWENARDNQKPPSQNLRRYGISTATYFLYAFGPWAVHPGDRESLQNRRSRSCVSIRRQPIDQEFRLPVSRRQLAASISLTDLTGNIMASTHGRVVLFWTPDYWYRPQAAIHAYKNIRNHLVQLKEFQAERERLTTKHGMFRRRRRSCVRDRETCDICSQKNNGTKDCIFNRIFSNNLTVFRGIQLRKKYQQHRSCGTTTYLRKLLKLDHQVLVWDLDSTTLARQLTLVDRELFLRIPKTELEILVRNRTSRDAPNFGAWIAFAHRMSCLTASEILALTKMETRARLIARFLNAAEKCLEMGNFHSARSIIAGLQSPAIYRLRDTWLYLKIHHSTKYEIMEKLGRIFKNTNTKEYLAAWLRAEKNPPVIPFVGDVLSRLLNHVNNIEILSKNSQQCSKNPSRKTNLKEQINEKRNFSKAEGVNRTQRGRSQARDEPRQSRKIVWTTCQRDLMRRAWNQWMASVHAKYGIGELSNWLERCQTYAQTYDFQGQTLAWEFLLKARYREDRDNFFLSLQLELPCEAEDAHHEFNIKHLQENIESMIKKL